MHGLDAVDALAGEIPLAASPCAEPGWTMSLPCGIDDIDEIRGALRGHPGIEVRDVTDGITVGRTPPPRGGRGMVDQLRRAGDAVTTAVHVNTTTYAATHVATNMLGSIRSIIKGSGLNPDLIRDQWATLEDGIATWLASRHLKAVTLEVYDPGKRAQRLRRPVRLHHRLRLLPRRRRRPVARPRHRCVHHPQERLLPRPAASTGSSSTPRPATPTIPGWAATTYRSTAGFTRHTVGTAHRRRQPRRGPVLLHQERQMITVSDAFWKFRGRLETTDTEDATASRRQQKLRGQLDEAFDIVTDFLTGAYRRHTKTKPLRDVDIMIVLRDTSYLDMHPREILEEVRKVLAAHYGAARVCTDRRAVRVDFGVEHVDDLTGEVISFDVVPAFEDGDHYLIPDDQLGIWVPTNPKIHAELATTANKNFDGQWKPLVKMIKKWNQVHGDPVEPSLPHRGDGAAN